MIRPDGRMLWIREEAEFLRDDTGTPFLIQGLMYDITEQREADDRQAFQATLLDSVSDAVISCDEGFVITSWNRAAQVLYGWSPDEVVGLSLGDVLGFEVADVSIGDSFDPSLGDPMGWQGRVAQQDKDGYEIVVETKGLPMRDADGNVVGYVMVNREVEAA
jgi:PAS domain S-box-containing protein